MGTYRGDHRHKATARAIHRKGSPRNYYCNCYTCDHRHSINCCVYCFDVRADVSRTERTRIWRILKLKYPLFIFLLRELLKYDSYSGLNTNTSAATTDPNLSASTSTDFTSNFFRVKSRLRLAAIMYSFSCILLRINSVE